MGQICPKGKKIWSGQVITGGPSQSESFNMAIVLRKSNEIRLSTNIMTPFPKWTFKDCKIQSSTNAMHKQVGTTANQRNINRYRTYIQICFFWNKNYFIEVSLQSSSLFLRLLYSIVQLRIFVQIDIVLNVWGLWGFWQDYLGRKSLL